MPLRPARKLNPDRAFGAMRKGKTRVKGNCLWVSRFLSDKHLWSRYFRSNPSGRDIGVAGRAPPFSQPLFDHIISGPPHPLARYRPAFKNDVKDNGALVS